MIPARTALVDCLKYVGQHQAAAAVADMPPGRLDESWNELYSPAALLQSKFVWAVTPLQKWPQGAMYNHMVWSRAARKLKWFDSQNRYHK